METRGEKRSTSASDEKAAKSADNDGDDATAHALAASEYPISIDAILPTIYFGSQNSSNKNNGSELGLDFLQSAPSTIRHNSIHRYSLATRTIAHYCRLEQIGEGTYGQVYRAKGLTPTLSHPQGGEMVAMKKIRLHHPGYMGIPPTVIREIKILKKLQHPNLVKMYEVVSSKGVEELDWEDEREDEKRKKEMNKNNNNNNNSTPNNLQLVTRENIMESNNGDNKSSKKSNDDNKKGLLSAQDSSKKKKKDSMSDLEKLRESYKGNLFLVLEYISHDLTGLLDMAHKFTEVQVKSITKQLLEVLEFMHMRNYVHRDLKSSNVLITDKYEVKLADFGLARCLESSFIGRMGSNDYNSNINSNEGEYTNKVITLWYRPPELLLGETKYGTAVDIWSAGCILAEVILGRPIFTGKTDMDQLKLIFDLIGTPTERSWEGFSELKLIRTGEVTIDRVMRPKLREKYRTRIQPATALDLLEKMLELDPKKRFTAGGALRHRYFQAEPLVPEDPKELGTINLGGDGSGYHEFQTKKRRREAKAVAKNAEEEAKMRGESVEKQKEAFDKAYRNHLKKGANAESNKESMPWKQPREQKQESRPWEEYREQQHHHQYDGPKQRRAFDRDEDPSCKRGRYHDGRSVDHGGTKDGAENVDTSSREFSRDGSYPKGFPDQNGQRIDNVDDQPTHLRASQRQYDKYGNPVGESRMINGPDRNRMLHNQDSWGEPPRGRDRWGSNHQGFGRPPDWGHPRGGRGGRPSEQGRHPGWPRNG